MKHEFSDYRDAECRQLKERPDLFFGLYQATKGNVCEGCPYGCRLNTNKKTNTFKNYKTNSEIAKSIGVSPRQVSKMRKRGEIKENER